jgi:hypothetical protein
MGLRFHLGHNPQHKHDGAGMWKGMKKLEEISDKLVK